MLNECSVLMLAGGLNPTPLQRLMGFPSAGLPISRDRTLLSAWLEVIDRSLGSLRRSTHLLCGTPADEHWFLAELRRPTNPVSGVEVRRDDRPHRGVCGILADTVQTPGFSDWLLVIELNTLPPKSLVPMLEASDNDSSMVVGGSGDGRPAGAFLLRADLLREVPKRGYYDLKEQFLPGASRARRATLRDLGAADRPAQLPARHPDLADRPLGFQRAFGERRRAFGGLQRRGVRGGRLHPRLGRAAGGGGRSAVRHRPERHWSVDQGAGGFHSGGHGDGQSADWRPIRRNQALIRDSGARNAEQRDP
jgi:hypothetical protein